MKSKGVANLDRKRKYVDVDICGNEYYMQRLLIRFQNSCHILNGHAKPINKHATCVTGFSKAISLPAAYQSINHSYIRYSSFSSRMKITSVYLKGNIMDVGTATLHPPKRRLVRKSSISHNGLQIFLSNLSLLISTMGQDTKSI